MIVPGEFKKLYLDNRALPVIVMFDKVKLLQEETMSNVDAITT